MHISVPIEWLRQRYQYSPETGVIRQVFAGGGRKAGEQAGSVNGDGYIVIKLRYDGRRYEFRAHRLAWALHYGEHPVLDVDHKNTIRDDNRSVNLRQATRSQNLANRNKTSALPKGVTFRKNRKTRPFQASLHCQGVYHYLGTYETAEAAHMAYVERARTAFGEFMRV